MIKLLLTSDSNSAVGSSLAGAHRWPLPVEIDTYLFKRTTRGLFRMSFLLLKNSAIAQMTPSVKEDRKLLSCCLLNQRTTNSRGPLNNKSIGGALQSEAYLIFEIAVFLLVIT